MPYSSVNLRQDFRHLSDIIGVYPNRDHTCVGMAVSKGRRCQARTNAPNRAHAIRLLDEGTRLLQLGQRNIDNILEALAPLLLCTRYHQNQAATVARQWSQQVEIDQRRSQDTTTSSVTFPVARNSSQQPRDREAITRRSRESSTLSSFTTNTQSSLSSDTGLDDLKDTFEALLRLLEGASQRASGSINTSSVASARTGESTRRSLSSAEPIVTRNERTSNATPQISGHSSERRRASSGTTTSSRQVRGNERGVSPPTRSSAVASTRNATDIPTTFQQTGPAQSPSIGETSNRQPQRRARTERREVVRKPIEGECYICFMSLRDSEEAIAAQGEEEERQFQADNTATTEARPNGPEEVVWCKNQCGYNFHKNCVEAWTNSCERNHNAVTCPMCRTQWVRQ